eukprot:TRINITY_DN1407_c0_g1_i1.p1 TRINITY_DN1407_c0_g1~~TRINITY_DN1407_c0_g1_i1.p1  ORF type:complete len:384 (+),score=127.99 TRINITY_DN1407_c0_g1_i1:37-1188(+)
MKLGYFFVFLLLLSFSYTLDNGLALQPPMGWSTWNYYACNINETVIIQTAKSMISSGMKDAGYEYINIDDCWQVGRYPNGTIIADPVAFPNGIAYLANEIHNLGLKLGIYTCAGNYTCQGRPGSRGYECIDAQTYADWKIDFVKEDWCHTKGMNPENAYQTMSKCLNETNRPMVFSICDWGRGEPWKWGNETGNQWRTTNDIKDTWYLMLKNFDLSKRLSKYAGPGGWNDLDMLEVGNGGMSNIEYRTHFSLWAMLSSPLIAGNNLNDMDNDTLNILTAPDVIAVNQDPLGIPAHDLYWDVIEGREALARPLSEPNTYAVILFNRHRYRQKLVVYWDYINPDYNMGTTGKVYDLWERTSLGNFTGEFTATLEGHDVSLIKVTF